MNTIRYSDLFKLNIVQILVKLRVGWEFFDMVGHDKIKHTNLYPLDRVATMVNPQLASSICSPKRNGFIGS